MAVVAVSYVIAPIMPDIVLKGITLTFRGAIDSRAVLLVPIVIPLGFLAQVFLPNNFLRLLPFLAVMSLGPLTVTLMASEPSGGKALIILACIAVLTWVAFVLLLRYHCTRRSLLRRG